MSEKLKVKLYDRFFSHESSTTPSVTPKYWAYGSELEEADLVVLSHDYIINHPPEIANLSPLTSIVGLITESRAIIPQIYDAIAKMMQSNEWGFLEVIGSLYTYDKQLIDLGAGFARYCPASEPWVGTPWGGGERKMYAKDKVLSMIASNKELTALQQCRVMWARHIYENGLGHVFGNSVGKPIDKIVDGLAPYKFSVVFENCVADNYFTEKLTNCFACGTIPIYCGAPNIGEFFDLRGILVIDDVHDVKYWIEQIHSDPSLYESMLPYAEENLRRIKDRTCTEDFIHEKYFLPA